MIFLYLDAGNYNVLTVATLWAPVVSVSSMVFTWGLALVFCWEQSLNQEVVVSRKSLQFWDDFVIKKTILPILYWLGWTFSQLSFPSLYCNFIFHTMQIYLLDIHIFYTLVFAFLGFLLGVRDRLGKVSVVTLLFCLRNVKIKIFITVTTLSLRG